ncbi:SH3 domain-containing protein [Corallococcus sp. CA054B]|uniref:SH3 domain-containing protein n=1 Tax=Corallococcus sp. CA054B TaxID=2316734 RepID=UPI000EA09FC6|nr:SH3 domain-containing protein [Corallococcus sp. CA054B]RKG67365.1 SH3 domain-containing protein [Corallococcus sp. CA054B]
MIQFSRFLPLAVPPRPEPLPAPAGKAPTLQPAPQPRPFGAVSTFDAAPAPASNLHTERLGDGSANCLEKAVGLARPGDSIVLMRDASDGVGHALVRKPDGSVVDPNHPTVRYETLGQWQAMHPRYSQPVPVPAGKMQQVLSTPPGPQREALIQKLGLSGVADRQVADGERWVSPDRNINLRSDAGTSFGIIEGLVAGDKLKVIDQNEAGTWLKVELANGTQGWVFEDFTQPTDAPPPPPPPLPPYESPVPAWLANGTNPPEIEVHVWTKLSQAARDEVRLDGWEAVVAKTWPMPEFDVNGPPPPSVDPLVWNHLPPEGKQSLFREEWQAAVHEHASLLFKGVPEGGVRVDHPFLGTDSSLGRGKVDQWREFAVNPNSAAQYLNLHQMLGDGWRTSHKNLCGPLAVGASMGLPPDEALALFKDSDGATSANLLNGGGTTDNADLMQMYEAAGWSSKYKAEKALPPEEFARFLANGDTLVALVDIDTGTKADGKLSASGTAHWVNVRAVEEGANGEWTVRVYNPFQNREEVYSWKDFEASWAKTADNRSHGLLVATPPPPDAATSP